MKITLLIVLLAAALLAPASASFPEKSSVKEYFDDSEIVAYVRIESGVIHRINGYECGVNYQVDVLRTFKGNPERTISFVGGPSASSVEIGKRYLVFLSTQHGYDRRKMQQYYGMPDEFLGRCKTDQSFLQPTILLGEELDGITHSFVVPERIVAFPSSVPSKSGVSVLGSISVLDPKYVGKDDAFLYLQSLGCGT